jgi:hypothetical protein
MRAVGHVVLHDEPRRSTNGRVPAVGLGDYMSRLPLVFPVIAGPEHRGQTRLLRDPRPLAPLAERSCVQSISLSRPHSPAARVTTFRAAFVLLIVRTLCYCADDFEQALSSPRFDGGHW